MNTKGYTKGAIIYDIIALTGIVLGFTSFVTVKEESNG